jgi:hypothetical protein
MSWSAVAADAVVVFHLLFILFALLGGLLVCKRPAKSPSELQH